MCITRLQKKLLKALRLVSMEQFLHTDKREVVRLKYFTFDFEESLFLCSGKTHTMVGPSALSEVSLMRREDRGIIPRAINDLFDFLLAKQEQVHFWKIF